MPLTEFARLLADESSSSVVVASSLDGDTVTGEFLDMPVDVIARTVARRLGCSCRVAGRTIFLGEAKPEDRGQLVRRVRRLEPDKIREVLQHLAGEGARSVVENDGLVVVLDRVEVLEEVATALESIEKEESAVWIVQLHLVGWSRRAAEEYGFDLMPAGALAANLAIGSAAKGIDIDADVTASLDGVLRLANERDDVAVVAAPMLVLLDGEEATFVQGDKVPIPKKVVSDQGTVTTAGFEFVQTGTQVSVKLRERTETSAKLTLEVSMSDLRRLIEESAPVTGEEKLTTAAVVEAGGVYLLGSLSRDRRTGGAGIGFQTQDYVTSESQVIQVWCEAFRVAGPLTKRETVSAEVVDASPATVAEPATLNATPVDASPALPGVPLKPASGTPGGISEQTEKREGGARVGVVGGELGETWADGSPWSPPTEAGTSEDDWQAVDASDK